METESYFKRVRLVGGNLALEFVNTQAGPLDAPPDVDTLDGYQDLVDWSRQVGTITDRQVEALTMTAREHPAAASSVFRKATRMRSYLWEIFSAWAHEQQPDAPLLDLLRDDAAIALRYARLSRVGEVFGWDWAGCNELSAPVWPIAHAAVELVQSSSLTRVKQCGSCRFLFVDTSKNGSRRWCSMEDCGKTVKMSRYVARRSASRALARSGET
jgi:predicted RNA-binding Zn ribbon-like protein